MALKTAQKMTSSLGLLLFSLNFLACSSKPAATAPPELPRIPASGKSDGDKLPSTFNKHSVGTEQIQTNYCWVVKIDPAEPDLQRYFMPTVSPQHLLTEADIGKYTVLGEVHYFGFGGDGYPKFKDAARKAVSYDEAVQILETNDDCTAW